MEDVGGEKSTLDGDLGEMEGRILYQKMHRFSQVGS